MSKKKRTAKLCYLCGKPGADTKDHAPPRGMFPNVPEGNLITVPAHRRCGERFQKDDERFRNDVITASWPSKRGRIAWDKQVVPSFQKNPGAREDIVRRLGTLVVENRQEGGHVQFPILLVPADLLQRHARRITRGLFYHRFKAPLPQDLPVEVLKLQPAGESIPELHALLAGFGKTPRWVHVVPGIFTYCHHGVFDRERKAGMVILVFFDTLVCRTFYCMI